jgi:hypothetical protein
MKTQLLTIPQFAKATGLTYWLARDLVNRGDIPSVQVGSRRRGEARMVERWLKGEHQVSERPGALLAAAASLDEAAVDLPERACFYEGQAAELRAIALPGV